MGLLTKKPPWYSAGLAFECQQCGRCCAGPIEGYVWVSDEDVRAIAARLGLSEQQMRARHVRKVGRRQSLREDARTKDCIFLQTDGPDGRGCAIYEFRPIQCRTWPFWATNLVSPDAWAMAQLRCAGINRGPVHCVEHIEGRRDATRE